MRSLPGCYNHPCPSGSHSSAELAELFASTFTASQTSRTVLVALALFPGVFEVPWGDIAAASILASLPPVLIVVGLGRFPARRLLAGALKE